MSFPDVSEAFSGLFEPIKFTIVSKAVDDDTHELKEQKSEPVTFLANLQPMDPAKVKTKPEGQRLYTWWTMFTSKMLDRDAIIEDHEGKQFRVDTVSAWRGSHFEYDLVENVTK